VFFGRFEANFKKRGSKKGVNFLAGFLKQNGPQFGGFFGAS
jgi:hypothetical protein